MAERHRRRRADLSVQRDVGLPDSRPWQEHAPSFASPTEAEWAAALAQLKAQLTPQSNFGFPDASKPHGIQPAFTIYAWNEYGEGGILGNGEVSEGKRNN